MTTPLFRASEFRKATRSNPNANCVCIARRSGTVEVRDDKQPFGSPGDTRLRFTDAEFDTFLAGVRAGQLAGQCLEIIDRGHDVNVLRSTVPQAGEHELTFTDDELLAFYDGVHRGEFSIAAFTH